MLQIVLIAHVYGQVIRRKRLTDKSSEIMHDAGEMQPKKRKLEENTDVSTASPSVRAALQLEEGAEGCEEEPLDSQLDDLFQSMPDEADDDDGDMELKQLLDDSPEPNSCLLLFVRALKYSTYMHGPRVMNHFNFPRARFRTSKCHAVTWAHCALQIRAHVIHWHQKLKLLKSVDYYRFCRDNSRRQHILDNFDTCLILQRQ